MCYQTPLFWESLPQTCTKFFPAWNSPKTDPVSVCMWVFMSVQFVLVSLYRNTSALIELSVSLSSCISCCSGSPRMWGKWGGVGGGDASLSFSRAGFGFQSASNTESEWESYQNNQVFSSIFDGVDYCLNVTCCLFPRQHPCKQLKIIEGVYLLLRKSAFSFQALDVVALIYVCINTVFQFVDVTDMRIVCMCCNVLQCTAM